MECCFDIDGCEDFAITPVLVTPCYPQKCAEDPPMCYPCLPGCAKGKLMYCCEKRAPRAPARTPRDGDRDRNQDCSHARNMPSREPPPQRDNSCCQPTCKPVRTKYVIPCYRYEDGRIRNQPTVLMRRACEVAVGARSRRKPFVESSFSSDPEKEIRRFISEDERGNYCYHVEMKNAKAPGQCPNHLCPNPGPRPQCVSCPECQYTDCVKARVIPANNNSCCYYCT
ncbi:uncharacterized protein LOC106140079 [Amyelois transitella]|uniref:uncharacterized protein LOC106140079 n=1 Tax=Amyelois transitella TaxID=680683 RepID=UPI00298F8290|nr:uncharacterized protein LOC106140079 [Amyelois transitella]